MNWAAISFDWNQVRAFLATVEEGTLSGAARALRLTQPTLGRQVAALEESLNITLFERVGKSLILTQAGMDLLEHVRAMGEAANRISLSAAGHVQEVQGEVRISVADSYAAYILPDILKRLRKEAPGLTIDIVAENRVSDLRRREADIAIRHMRPEDPELIGKRLRDGTGSFYASTDWLDRNGRPKTLAELEKIEMIGIDQPERMVAELNKRGIPVSHMNFLIRTLNSVVAWEMVRRGLGVGVGSDLVAAGTPEVEKLQIEELAPITFPNWLVTHRELRNSRRIRVVFDLLAEELG